MEGECENSVSLLNVISSSDRVNIIWHTSTVESLLRKTGDWQWHSRPCESCGQWPLEDDKEGTENGHGMTWSGGLKDVESAFE